MVHPFSSWVKNPTSAASSREHKCLCSQTDQGGEHRWAFLSSLWLIMVLGKFSLCSWPICRWGLLHLDQTGNGTHPDPDDEGDTLGRQQILVLLLVLAHQLLTDSRFCFQPPSSFLTALSAELPARAAATQRADHPLLLLATSTLSLFLLKNMG